MTTHKPSETELDHALKTAKSFDGIHYIQIEMPKSAENYDKHRFEVYRKNLLGLDEMRHSA